MKPVVKWYIFRKVTGVPWPGEEWESCKSESAARKTFLKDYDIGISKGCFRLVKATFEEVKP
jgi:hypothetical protein